MDRWWYSRKLHHASAALGPRLRGDDVSRILFPTAAGKKGVTVSGMWATKPRDVTLNATALQVHIGKRARKGKPVTAKVKAQELKANE